MLPALLRGAAVVTRLLHGNRRSRQAVRLVPGIVDGAARTIFAAAAGQPVGPVELGRALGAATNRVLGAGPARQAVMRRHARGLAHARRRYHGRRGGGPYRRYGRRPYRPGYGAYGRRIRYGARPGPMTIRRQPVRLGTVPRGVRVPGRGRAWSGLSRRFACRPAVAARAGRSAWSATCGCPAARSRPVGR